MLATAPSATRPRLILVAADVVGVRMAGPGIRFVKIAEQLAAVADVTLAVGIEGSDTHALSGLGFDVRTYTGRDELIALVRDHQIAFCQLIDEEVVRQGLAAGCRFIFDLYNALPAEAIGAERIGGFNTQPEMDDVFAGVVSFFRFCMRTGSYFVTSNERQRDFWIGYMLAADGARPSELGGRHTSDLVGLVPFGMEDGDPRASGHGIRGRMGISDDDYVLIWAGGIWDWFDAETPIRAVASLRAQHQPVRLVFYGTTHPNALIGRPAAVQRAHDLADQLGVLNDGVHFIDGWVPASERADYLLDADVAISAHKESFETRYAFRTRILDHFWADLPSIVTEGDWFAEYIDFHGLGIVVPYADVKATERAILALADEQRRSEFTRHVQQIRDDWRWRSTTRDVTEVIASWEQKLLPRQVDVADPVVPQTVQPPTPSMASRLRTRLSRSPIGGVYRRIKRVARR